MEAMLDLYARLPEIEDNPLPIEERINPFGGFVQSLRRYVPVGVVAAISAYNFPLHISLWKLFTALATGNCVILRPSPLTPLSTLALGEAALAVGLPRGVLHILAEAGPDGATLMTTDPAGRYGQLYRIDRGRQQGRRPGRAFDEAAAAGIGRQIAADFPARPG